MNKAVTATRPRSTNIATRMLASIDERQFFARMKVRRRSVRRKLDDRPVTDRSVGGDKLRLDAARAHSHPSFRRSKGEDAW